MEYGINTVLWVYPFSKEHLNLLKKIKNIGYDLVEIGITDFSDKNLIEIKSGFAENDLKCAFCAIPGQEESIISKNEKIQKNGVEYLKKVLAVCEKIDAKILVGPTYSVGKYPELIDPSEKQLAWDACVKNLKKVGKFAEDSGVKIAVEPLNRYETAFLNTASDAVKLIREIDNPNVGVQLDIYHMNIEEKNPADTIKKTGKHLFHFHVPEHDRGTPGTGHTNWEKIAKSVRSISFDGAVVIESCDPKVGSPIAEAGAIWRTYDFGQEELAVKGFKFIKELFR